MKIIYLLSIVLILSPLDAIAKEVKATKSSTKIFSQKIEFNLPEGWKPVFENADQATYMLEFVPAGQTKEKWNQMFTVQGFKGLAQKMSPKDFLGLMSNVYKGICPNQAIFELIEKNSLPQYETQGALLGCASMNKDHPSGLKAGMGEVAYFIAIKGTQDMYLFHKAIRGNKFPVQTPPLNKGNASDFMSNFMPIRLCNGKSKPTECLK